MRCNCGFGTAHSRCSETLAKMAKTFDEMDKLGWTHRNIRQRYYPNEEAWTDTSRLFFHSLAQDMIIDCHKDARYIRIVQRMFSRVPKHFRDLLRDAISTLESGIAHGADIRNW